MAQAKDIYPGMYIRMHNEILKVTKKEIANCGTHCHSKTRLIVRGLFSKGERSFNLGHNENVETVEITRKQGQVIAKLPGKVQVMDIVSYETVDADVEKELLEELNEGDTVIFINFEGKATVLEKGRKVY